MGTSCNHGALLIHATRFDTISDYYADPIDDLPIFFDSDSEFESDVMESARYGVWATMVCALVSMAIVGLLSWQFLLENRKEARGEKRLEKSEVRLIDD